MSSVTRVVGVVYGRTRPVSDLYPVPSVLVQQELVPAAVLPEVGVWMEQFLVSQLCPPAFGLHPLPQRLQVLLQLEETQRLCCWFL